MHTSQSLAVIALPLSGRQYVTLASPVFVHLLLARIRGMRPLETRAVEKWGADPAYRAHAERTPVLWFRSPRSS